MFIEQPEGDNKLELMKTNESYKIAREILSRFEFDTMYTKDNIISGVNDIDKIGKLGDQFQRTLNKSLKVLNYKVKNKRVNHGSDGKVRYYYITKIL